MIWRNCGGGELVEKETAIPKEELPTVVQFRMDKAEAAARKLLQLRPELKENYGRGDIGNGKLFADYYRDQARYMAERKQWYVYNGRKWVPDPGGLRVMELCKELADTLLVYALSLKDERDQDEYRRFVDKWQNRRYRETIIKDAASVYPVKMDDFDKDPFLFNCLNGTLDLRTGTFRPHRASDMLTMISGAVYDPNARSELWEKVVSDAMEDDAGLIVFLQKALGYGLTGDTSEECFFVLYGATTRNGKGTVTDPYMKMMGDYGRTAKPETIAHKDKVNGSSPSPDIARLAGARVVNISEPGKSMVLSAALVKTLTGNDKITARFLNENDFEFYPQFKFYINTNYLPHITDMTIFSSGRVKVIPFNRHYTEAEQDKTLKRKLSTPESLSAILNWCLDGLWLMRETGFDPPAKVLEATAQYRHNSDKIARFIDDTMEQDITGEIRTEDAYKGYQDWCTRNGHIPEAMPNFKQAMEGYAEIKRKRPNGAGREAARYWYICGMKWKCGQVWSPDFQSSHDY